MCNFKSGIIFKNRVELAPMGNEGHSDLLYKLCIDDNYINASKMFVRAELVPNNNNKATDIKEWVFNVDQDVTPDWFEDDRDRYENEFRDAVSECMKQFNIIVMAGRAWTKIKENEQGTYYMLFDSIGHCVFGDNNNYAESSVRDKLLNSELVKQMKIEYGDMLVPITTNLLSLDGLDDYGMVEGDLLAIPTIDLYRECRKNIPRIDDWYWLATPNSPPSGRSSDYVHYVYSDGDVLCCWYDCDRDVRPFCILQS